MFLPRVILAWLALVSIASVATMARATDDSPADLAASLAAPHLDGAEAADTLSSVLTHSYGVFEADASTPPILPVSRAEAWAGDPPPPCPPGPSAADKKKLKAAVGGAYKPLFYDNKFDYLYNESYNDYHLGEELKRRTLGCNVAYDVGGEYRLRYQSEHNLRARPLSGVNDDFWLHRTRVYLNTEVGDRFRFYGEAIDAMSDGQSVQSRSIEVNRFDALNLFGDFLLWEDCCSGGKLYVRGGRQELLYAAERFISPLDWSNTRRTFDGVKMFYQGERWDVDAWWTRPVPFGQHVNADGSADHNFDRPNDDQEFIGLYGSYKATQGKTADFYFLRLADYSGALVNVNGNAGDMDASLIGARLAGGDGPWLWEFEGGYQFGDFGPDDIDAGAFTVGFARKFECVRWQPTLWLYYDWASGDENPVDGDHNTFNQYFPLAHKYFGFMDIIARENISDFNALVVMKPADKLKLLFWYHVFHLDEATDALYNAGGVPIYRDPTGASGTDIGQELDIALNWSFRPRASVLFGYSHFWAGDYFDSPAIQAIGANGADADFFYTQLSIRF